MDARGMPFPLGRQAPFRLDLSFQNINDQKLISFLEWFQRQKAEIKLSDMPFRRVDLANNRTTDVPVPEDLFITAEGVKMLLDVFEKEGCTILDFDVHGNYVESGTAIAAFVTR